MNELMNIKEAAGYLRLNYMTLYKLAQKRKVPAFKVGGNWRFKKELLDRWMEQKANLNRGPVLIVDDDSSILNLLKEIVREQGYNVVTADTGESALDAISRQNFELVFLDLKLPGMNGLDVLEAIKEKDRDVLVVIVTAYIDEPITLKAMSLGPLLLVRKPFRENDILEVLNIATKGRTS